MIKKPLKIRKGAWFVRVRGSYIPCSRAGWLTYIPYTAYLVGALAVLVKTLGQDKWLLIAILYVPIAVAAAIIMNWIASQKS